MAKNEAEIVLSASERKLVEGLRRGEKAINTFGERARDSFRRTGAVINHVSDRYMTRFNTVLSGAGLALAGKAVIDFDSKLARVAIQAGLSGKQMMGLKGQLFEIAKATSQSPTDLLEGVSAIVERTGNFKFAVASLKDMGIVASATGARMEDIGATASNLQEKMGILPEQIMPVFDILNEQGKQGAFTLQNMASMFERLLSAANRFDVQGVAGMRQFGAFLQIARRGTGSSEEATTAVENTFNDILSKAEKLQDWGVQIIDPAKSKKAGRQVFRDFDQVLKDIIKKSNGDMLVLQKIFETRSMRAISPLVKSFKEFGDFREMDNFSKMGGSGAAVMKDFAFWSEQTAAKLGDMKTQLSEFANKNLAGPIWLLNKALTVLNNHPALTKGALYTLMTFAGVMTGAKMYRGAKDMIGGIRGAWRGTGGGGIAGGLGGTSGKAPMPVYVVNFPGQGYSMPYGGGWTGEGNPGGPAGKTRGVFRDRANVGAWRNWGNDFGIAAKASLIIGAGEFGWEIGKGISKLLGIDKGEAGSAFYDWTHKGEAERGKQQDALWERYSAAKKTGNKEEMKNLLNQIQIIVNVDRDGRANYTSNDMNTSIDVNNPEFGLP